MTSPKLLVVFLFLLSIGQSEQQDPNCKFSNNCKVDDNIAHISCKQNPANSPCECIKGADQSDCSAMVNGINYVNLTPDKCKGDTICTEGIDCTFWKYLREGSTQNHIKHCYLMDENQCQEQDETNPCNTDDHNEPTCRSGYREGVTCDQGSEPPTPTPSPPTTTPSDYDKCPGPIELGNDETMFYQQWFCYEILGGVPVPRDMYKADSSMPVGGYCQLTDGVDSCKQSTYRYTCTGTGADKLTAVEWKNDNGDQADLTTDPKPRLKEIGCKADPYTIEPTEQEGRMISCADEITANTIVENNACIMLCDNIPAFSIFTDFKVRGSRGWFYELTANGVKGELAPGMLDCWGKR